MEQENKEIAEFIKNNPFLDQHTFLELQLNVAIVISKKYGGMVVLGNSYDHRIVKKIYENVLDEDVVKECGRELYRFGMMDMLRCHSLLEAIIHLNYNKGNNKENYNRMTILPLARLVEHYWDGIGQWRTKP